MGLATMANWGSNLIVALTFLTLVEWIGPANAFWLYGVISVGSFIFSYRLVPETKGWTLEDISDRMESRAVSRNWARVRTPLCEGPLCEGESANMLRWAGYVGVALVTMTLQAAPPTDVEQRINRLLARMTLEEKLGQMSQSTSIKTPLSAQIKEEIRKGRWGSFLNAGSPADRAEAQRIARRESRLGIPLLFGRDVIHGYRTIFPIPLGQSASWDPDLLQQAARIAAGEASTEGSAGQFAPMIDITRDPRWGRVAEGLGKIPIWREAGRCDDSRLSNRTAEFGGCHRGVRQALRRLWRGRSRPRIQQHMDS